MINLINVKTHFDDNRNVTVIAAKFKSEDYLTEYPLVATVLSAVYQTTFVTDEECASIRCSIDNKRKNIADLTIRLNKPNRLSIVDVANFVSALQSAIDATKLF